MKKSLKSFFLPLAILAGAGAFYLHNRHTQEETPNNSSQEIGGLERTIESTAQSTEPKNQASFQSYINGINPTREDFVEEYSSKFRKLENRRLGEIIPEGDYFRNSYPESARALREFGDYSDRTFGEVFTLPSDDEIARLWDPQMEREYKESLSVRGIPEWATEVDCGTDFTGVEDYVNLVSPLGPHGRPRFLRERLTKLAKFNSVMSNPDATGLEIAEADHLREEAKGWFSFRARRMMGEYLRKKDGEIYALADYLLEVNSE